MLKSFRYIRLLALAILVTGVPFVASAQDGPPRYVRDAVDAVLAMLDSEGEAAIVSFIDKAMVPAADRDKAGLIERLSAVRKELTGLRDDIAVEAEPDGVRVILAAGATEKHIKVVIGPDGISDLYFIEAPERIDVTCENLNETFDRFEAEGVSGVVYIRLDGEVVLERPLGLANKALGVSNQLNTVFGIGSRPIDFTIAAIYLLDQQGHIGLDDKIDKYFEHVPADKSAITIRHLMTGQSGLPDFFHAKNDWDPDLAWIDREIAERRLMSQSLLFAPGAGREHSHGAFVLLAALIERLAGKSYYGFVREHFLDPAGMSRTGEYGEIRGMSIHDFAAGCGPQFIGVPNIPPNWGPTSWLVKGSGGMYSTLGDLMKFYEYVRSGKVLDDKHNVAFRQPTVNIDGSDRGFELFSAFNPPDDEIYLFLNGQGDRGKIRQLIRALEGLVEFDR